MGLELVRGVRAHAGAVALLAGCVLLTACDDAAPGAAACDVQVDTPDLVQAREDAGIADCDPAGWTVGDGQAADLPDLEIGCLGSTSTASLSDVHGPAVINVWGSNCGPCRSEMPALADFDRQYGDQVTVLGLDFLDTYPGAALDLAARSEVTYPSLADACGDLQSKDLAIVGLPTFLFVKADGTVEQAQGGKDSVAQIVEMTEHHLGITLTAPKDGTDGDAKGAA